MIASWFASKLFGPIAAGLAALFLVGFIVQTVRIDGWPIFGGGLREELASEKLLRVTAEQNVGTLRIGLGRCNASIDETKLVADARVAAAQAEVDRAHADAGRLQGNINRLRAIRSTSETCPVAETILEAAFQ